MAQLKRVSSLAFSEASNHHDLNKEQNNQEIVMMERVGNGGGENGYVNPGFNGPVQVPELIMDSNKITGDPEYTENPPIYNGNFNSLPNYNGTVSLPNNGTNGTNGADEAAVVVINACKSYKTCGKPRPVLHNFCMTVKKGTIYSLLGSSGCGKTTLLACILDIRKLESGKILIFGKKTGTKESGVPGKRVGYMPQDIALYGDFSIQETISYFGSLYGMKSTAIEKSREVLMNLLSLPEESRRISTLSGGQKRRVSLAVSLVHSPSLIVVDEPTVGLDPLLRDNIWNHLIKLVSNGKTTVIITTHYIEEAKQSDTVGVMRGGRLLTEKSPKALFDEFKTTSLEAVVLTLCHQDEKDSLGYGRCRSRSGNLQVTVDRRYSHPAKKLSSIAPPGNSGFGEEGFLAAFRDSLVRIKSLTMKNAFVMLRNIFLVLFVILLPALQTVIMGMSMGNDPRPIKVGVVNHDYNYTGGCNLEERGTQGECEVANLSCRYMRSLPADTIQLTYYDSEDVAREDIKAGKIRSFMSFSEGYSDAMYERSTTGVLVDNETLQNSMLFIEMDASNAVVTKSLQRIVFEAYKNFVQGLLSDCGFNPELGGLPIKFQNPIYGRYDLQLREYVAAGMLVGVALFFPLCSSSITYIWDKKQGTMERARVAGTKTFEIMIAYYATEGTILILQTLLSMLILVFIFEITIVGSAYLAVMLLLLNGFAGISLGLLLASICSEEIQAILMGLAIIFPNFFLAGAIWPIEGMPIVLQYLSYALPGTLACEAFRSIVVKGWGILHFYVWTGFVSTFAWCVLYWILGIWVHRVTFSKK